MSVLEYSRHQRYKNFATLDVWTAVHGTMFTSCAFVLTDVDDKVAGSDLLLRTEDDIGEVLTDADEDDSVPDDDEAELPSQQVFFRKCMSINYDFRWGTT